MYMTYKDLIYQLSTKIMELSKLQNDILVYRNLDEEASEDCKEIVNGSIIR